MTKYIITKTVDAKSIVDESSVNLKVRLLMFRPRLLPGSARMWYHEKAS